MKGYVYILSNPAMPGLVKIGKTTRSVEQRMEELYQSGVPQKFSLQRAEFFPDCHTAERHMHSIFHDKRLNAGREFFHADLDMLRVMEVQLEYLLKEQVEEVVFEFMPDHVVRRPECIVDTPELHMVELPEDVDFHDVASVISFISPSAWIMAKREYEAIRSGGSIEHQDHERGI